MALLQPTKYSYQDLARLMTLMTGDEKHSFSATSTLDVVWTLYDSVMKYDP
ncbi:MAG: transketolase, partial [Dehalococcoidia bacterium]